MVIKFIVIDMDGIFLLFDYIILFVVKNVIVVVCVCGVNVVLMMGCLYVGVYNYLKELYMEQLGDYCIIYNGVLVQKVVDGSIVV